MSDKYCIVYIIDGLGNGGAERLMVPLLKYLDADRFKARVCVLQNHHGNPVAEDIRALGIPVDLLPVHHLRDITAVFRLRKYLQKYRTDLIHTQLDFSDILGNMASRLLRIPSVCTIHVSPFKEKRLMPGIRQKLSWLCHRKFCDRVISVSEKVREDYLHVSQNSPLNVETIHNGIDLTRFEIPDKNEMDNLRQSLGIPAKATVILTIAMLRKEKGIQYMIEAFPPILKHVPDLYYLIVGSGDYAKTLLEKAGKSSVKDRIVFAGMRQDIPRLMYISRLFVLPTLTEALPTVVAEAMAAGKPVIASAVGGIPEMITDTESGLLISPADPEKLANACVYLLKDPEKIQMMGAGGRQIANEKFNIRRQIHKIERVYQGLLDAYGK